MVFAKTQLLLRTVVAGRLSYRLSGKKCLLTLSMPLERQKNKLLIAVSRPIYRSLWDVAIKNTLYRLGFRHRVARKKLLPLRRLVRSVYNSCWSTSAGPLSNRLESFRKMKCKSQLVLAVSSMPLDGLAKSGKIAVLLRDTKEVVGWSGITRVCARTTERILVLRRGMRSTETTRDTC